MCSCFGSCPRHLSESFPSHSGSVHLPQSGQAICSCFGSCPRHLSESSPSHSGSVHLPHSAHAICSCSGVLLLQPFLPLQLIIKIAANTKIKTNKVFFILFVLLCIFLPISLYNTFFCYCLKIIIFLID